MREVAERTRVPRALFTRFPLGRSLGKPDDKAFQHEVLQAAFDLLKETRGPVISEFPASISSTDGEPLVWTPPPGKGTDLHPAVDEAQTLMAVYDRAYRKNKRTSVGRKISAEQVPETLERFVSIVEGTPWDEGGMTAKAMYATGIDIRSYYEEIACELSDGPVSPWATEAWFYDRTEAGQLILSARRKMKEAGVDQSVWFGLAPAGRE